MKSPFDEGGVAAASTTPQTLELGVMRPQPSPSHDGGSGSSEQVQQGGGGHSVCRDLGKGQPGSECPGEPGACDTGAGLSPIPPPRVPAWFEFSGLSDSGMPDASADLGHKRVNINPRNLASNINLFGLAAWGTARF